MSRSLWAAAALTTLALAGCAAPPPDSRAAYEPVTDVTTANNQMATLPPGAGATVAVLQNKTRGILTQRIVLRGDPDTIGENAIVVKVDQSLRHPADIDGPVGRPDKAMIAAELDSNFAGLDMEASQTFARNSFGPFGYAIGHPSARVTCMYAWQWGMAKPLKLGDAPVAAASMPTEPTSVRVRLCRSTIGETEMVALLPDLQVFPRDSREAYADADSVGERVSGQDALAAAGVGYYVGGSGPATRVALAPAPNKHKRKRRKHPRLAAEPVEERAAYEAPPTGAPLAPMPGELGSPVRKSAPSANPLLAPLAAAPAATPRASADDMPLPAKASPLAVPAGVVKQAGSVPLPN